MKKNHKEDFGEPETSFSSDLLFNALARYMVTLTRIFDIKNTTFWF